MTIKKKKIYMQTSTRFIQYCIILHVLSTKDITNCWKCLALLILKNCLYISIYFPLQIFFKCNIISTKKK